MQNTKLFILSLVFLLNLSCQSIGQQSETVNNQNINQPPQPPTNYTNVNTNQNFPRTVNLKSSYQKRPRREKILFPDDCTDSTPAGEEVRYLPMACAEALKSAQADLQKVSEEEECSHPISAEDNRSYEVVDDEKILSYKIKNSDETNISLLTNKLGTVIESFIKNNKLEFPIEFKVGQELKYQKAHYEYDFEPTFYSLSPNKYLVEMRCSTAAYNLSNIYSMYDESELPAKVNILEFPDFTFEYDENSDTPKVIKEITSKTVGGRYFNPQTKELIVFIKARGIGDAGRYARYSFPNGTPKLEEFRAKFKWEGRGYQAGDVIKSPPKTWKRYYPK
jgi:hypothetical protein